MTTSFVDEELGAVEFKSTWKKERSLKESSMVTDELKLKDRSVQSIKKANQEVQTEDEIHEDIQLYEDDSPELARFLAKVEPLLYKELQKNRRSHAFDGYEAAWGDETESVTCTHTLTHAGNIDQLPVTCLSWNCTGSVIAVAYGRFDHEDWCTHKSALCTWNIDRRQVDAGKADIVVDLPSCLMCLSYHPTLPSVIAGGTFGGEVLVWDLSREDDLLLVSSGVGKNSHRDPVTKLHWVVDTDAPSRKYNLVSVGNDGRILVWKLNQHQRTLQLADGFALLMESLPRSVRVRDDRNSKRPMGITSVSFQPDDETAFLVACESGGLFRCSTKTRGTVASGELVGDSMPLHSPVNFSFHSHDGPAHSVEFSPFHRNLFMSCGADCTARIYSVLQTQPVLTIEPNAGYLYSASWSPVRPTIVAMVTASGQLVVYDLKKSHAAAILQVDVSANKLPAHALQFNPSQTTLLAVGNAAGQVLLWKLNDELSQQIPSEQEFLEEIARVALE